MIYCLCLFFLKIEYQKISERFLCNLRSLLSIHNNVLTEENPFNYAESGKKTSVSEKFVKLIKPNSFKV